MVTAARWLWRGLEQHARLTVLLLALLYAAILSVFAILAHRGLNTQMDDLGNAVQAIYRAAHGDLTMQVTNNPGGAVYSRFAVHANLVFWLLAPLFRLWPEPEWLLALSSLACASGGVALWLIARRRLGSGPLALAAALAFWLSPLVHDANLYDFHVTTLMTAAFLWSFWGFDAGRPRLAWVCLLLALMCKEDAPFVGVAFGALLALRVEARLGVRVIIVCLLYAVVLLFLLVPALVGDSALGVQAGGRYAWLRGGQALLEEPLAVAARLLQPDKLRLPLYFLLLGAGAGLRGWPALLPILPTLGLSLLSDLPWSTRVAGTYYFVSVSGFIVLSCVLSAQASRRGAPLLWALGASTVAMLLFSPLPVGAFASLNNYRPTPSREVLTRVDEMIPAEARLCVQNNLGPHLATRDFITAALESCASADYQLWHLRYTGGPRYGVFVRQHVPTMLKGTPKQLARRVAAALQSKDFGLLLEQEGFFLFARGEPGRVDSPSAQAAFDRELQALDRSVQAGGEAPLSREWRQRLLGRWRWTDLSNPHATPE